MLDYRALDPTLAATLAAGLPERSRAMRRAAGNSPDPILLLLAAILDHLQILNWDKNPDHRPEFVVDRLLQKDQTPDEALRFATPAEFEAARADFLEKEAAEHGGRN